MISIISVYIQTNDFEARFGQKGIKPQYVIIFDSNRSVINHRLSTLEKLKRAIKWTVPSGIELGTP